MDKWYEQTTPVKGSNYISSRIRLARNWTEYVFPGKMDTNTAAEMIGRLQYMLDGIGQAAGSAMQFTTLDRFKEPERYAMHERRLFSSSVAQSKAPVGLMYTAGEDVGMVLNGDDHIRLQVLGAGLLNDDLFERAFRMDDFISSRIEYAFDKKYGYLTSFPTNVGTGMRANVVIHLPALSRNAQFSNIIEGLSRFGVTIRGVYGKDKDNAGSLYDISNSKTLGLSEREITDLVRNAAVQLNDQENKAREVLLKGRMLDRLDEVYRAYGILKYSRKIGIKPALNYLSLLMYGLQDGLIKTDEHTSIYSLMLGIQPYNLLIHADRPLNSTELDAARADYLRQHLPGIREE